MASLALRCEGVAAEEVVLDDTYGYGELMDRLWADRVPFVLLEHDVVPWPGAVDKLFACPEPWCVHPYPFVKGGALGCIKVATFPPASFDSVMWNQLDAAVFAALLDVCPDGPHMHDPPFAHVK